jgi:tRNA dimethylallyltransferase
MKLNTCWMMLGPTAVGKTAQAIHLAKQLHAPIISCDSRQCYAELNIGVARPSQQELEAVPHCFIASHSIRQDLNAVAFEQYALDVIQRLFEQQQHVVMVGGTGLYAKAFCEGLDAIPDVSVELRNQIIANYEAYGIQWLQQEIKEKDPAFFEFGEIQNPQRLMRALEVLLSTGRSILSFRSNHKQERDFNIIKIGLELPRPLLVDRIHQRVDVMMQEGLLDEVKSLLPYQNVNALQTVGYRELFEFLNGSISLPQAVENIKINTRQYAKRQMTWFKRDEAITWCAPHEKQILQIVQDKLIEFGLPPIGI